MKINYLDKFSGTLLGVSIGDTILTDIYPAKLVGIKTIWVNRNNEKTPTEPERTPDHETSNLTSALGFLNTYS